MVDRAQRWLHEQLGVLRGWREHDPELPAGEPLGRALAGVEALEVAGALDGSQAAAWRERLAAEARGDVAPAEPDPQVCDAADSFLDDLLAGAPATEDRFVAACIVLSAAGAADAQAWDARLRERLGRPGAEEELARERALNAGPELADLVAVHRGPPDRRGGHRVVAVLRFADGVAFELDADEAADAPEWPDWTLTDDLGTAYAERSGDDARPAFVPAVPPGARGLELRLEGRPDVRFEVGL